MTFSRPASRIAVISGMVLVLELALIRQIPAEVRAIAYFTNLLFMAAFFGLGLGCILQRWKSVAWTLPAGLILLFGFVMLARGIVIYSDATEVHYWLQYSGTAGEARNVPLFVAAVTAFLLGALPFVAMGQQLARAMDEHPRLVAYGWDILGSLAGTVLFAGYSFLRMPPWLIAPLISALWAWMFVEGRYRRSIVALAGLPFLLFSQSPQSALWSPYYYLQYVQEDAGLRVFVNSSFHQLGIDFTGEEKWQREMQTEMLVKWRLPYDLYRTVHDGRSPQKVLVLGAGTGNDVHVASVNGAQEIVAVEIDPVILELGREKNPTRPYEYPGVRTVVDDARHYLRTSDETFDLIVFGTLDSQALLSSHANLRLENYVYTREAMEDARRMLRPGGAVALYYSVFESWLYGRIYSTVRDVFGEQTRIFASDSSFLFNTVIIAANGFGDFRESPEKIERFGQSIRSTDDWPFIYLERPTVAPIYLKFIAIVVVLIAAAFVMLRRLHPVQGLHANFLFLGLGFTLMESSAIVRLALVFGSTWTVNAVVFASVLLTVWLANLSVLRNRAPSLRVSWIALAAAVAVNWLFPLRLLFEVGTPLRVVACAVLIGAPVYFAAVCFSRLFAEQKVTGYPLGINLIGAMGGGLIEYVSMAIGLRAIWLVVLGVYAMAWLTSHVLSGTVAPGKPRGAHAGDLAAR